jgi:hypothetical protein
MPDASASGASASGPSASGRARRSQRGKTGRPAVPLPAGGESAIVPPAIADAAGHPAGPRDEAAILDLLATGTLDVKGRLVDASNATMYCTISAAGTQRGGAESRQARRGGAEPGGAGSGWTEAACVYKPVAGERPLWDFPDGTLAGRELAAYLVSRAGGFDVVPPTVYREGPFGPGMCQLWIDGDTSVDLVELARSDDARLRQMAVFDAVVNNADRKIGHLLPVATGQLYGCDHGVCFGSEYKLRTVLWQWRGKQLTPQALDTLHRLRALLAGRDLAAELGRWLTTAEIAATVRRVERLLAQKVHPYPPADWPAVPWPPV